LGRDLGKRSGSLKRSIHEGGRVKGKTHPKRSEKIENGSVKTFIQRGRKKNAGIADTHKRNVPINEGEKEAGDKGLPGEDREQRTPDIKRQPETSKRTSLKSTKSSKNGEEKQRPTVFATKGGTTKTE